MITPFLIVPVAALGMVFITLLISAFAIPLGETASIPLVARILAVGPADAATVVTSDGDLQNDPRDIPRMLGALEGYDAVTGWRQQRDDPWLKRVSSRVANGIRNAITREHVHDSACTLRVIRSGCLPSLPRFRGFHRFVPTLLQATPIERRRGRAPAAACAAYAG